MQQIDAQVSLDEAINLHRSGRLQEAEEIYRDILKAVPNNFDCLHLLGVAQLQRGNYHDALQLIDTALSKNPRSAIACNNRGAALRAMGRLTDALSAFAAALALDPEYSDALSNQGAVLNELGRNEEALASYDKALAIKPDTAEALNNQGKILGELKRNEEAIEKYQKALELRPNYIDALYNRGNSLERLGRYDDALSSYQKVLSLDANHVDALVGIARTLINQGHYPEALVAYDKALSASPDATIANGRGSLLRRMQRYGDALASFDKAIALKPDYAEAHRNRGAALKELGRFADALASYDQALVLRPESASTLHNRAILLQILHRPEDAIASYDRAIKIKPTYASAFNNRGNALLDLGRHIEAIDSYERAIALQPNYPIALSNKGNALRALKRLSEALMSYEAAVALDNDCAEAHYNRGIVLTDLNRDVEALACYQKAFELNPDLRFLQGARLHAKMMLCDWSHFELDASRLLTALSLGKPASQPFPLLAIPCKPEDQLQCARLYVANQYPPSPAFYHHRRERSHGRIRVGYLSGDFHDHATAFLMAGMFELHNREEFETFAISYGPKRNNEMRQRLQRSFDHFIDVSELSDQEIAGQVYRLEIDIAVDLKGFTQNTRFGALASRPARLQVAYLGFPGTLGASYIDYLVADRILVPPEHQSAYAENIVYLPDSYQVNDSSRPIPIATFSRRDVGLPEKGFVFCCFNHHYKITPDIFDVWMRLLRDVDGSVLWLLQGIGEASQFVESNLRAAAESRGVAGDRLIFAPRTTSGIHLARHLLADLFIDTLHCNAHTTASDALWAGLPLVTCLGPTFAGRVAASLLNAVGLAELITDSLHEYEVLARKIAQDPMFLLNLKARLIHNRGICPLFNTKAFVRHMENAYRTMWDRYRHGEQPESFAVARL
jgi:protein O-GlcNAc transferase